ncbi:hypothetical protein, partial [Streptomyces sp. NPDC055140]
MGREHEEEGYRAYREYDFRDFATAATHHARRLHATLIETDGAIDAELDDLTRQALADPELLAAMGIPAHPLTSNAPVPYAPALLDWLSARAADMSPLLRHTLHADFTPRGFTGAFARLAATVARNATGTAPARAGGRLPVPPQWQEQAEVIDRLLDAAATDPVTVGLTVSNDPIDKNLVDLVRDWILDQVMEQYELMEQLAGPYDTGEAADALIDAFYGDEAAIDLLAGHITAHTAQSARLTLQPAPATLYAVRRGGEVFVCRGTDLHERLGQDAGLRISWQSEDPWRLWSRDGGRAGTLQPLTYQTEADRFAAAAHGLTPSAVQALLYNNPGDWPALIELDEDTRSALITYATTEPEPQAHAPGSGIHVRATEAGEWALDVLHATPFPPGPQAVQGADLVMADLGQWLADHRALLDDVTPWHAQATQDALANAVASIPAEGGNGGPDEHWLAMAEAHQHLLFLHGELTADDGARPLHQPLAQLNTLLRVSDNYLARAAVRGRPDGSRASLRRVAGKTTFTSLPEAGAALAGLQAAWREWASEIGPLQELPAAERNTVIALSALLDVPRPGATARGWYVLLSKVMEITELRARDVSDRMLGWRALGGVAEDLRQRWAATMLTEPGLAAAAARQTGVLDLARPELDSANPPTSPDDFASRHAYVIRLAQRVLESGALRTDERHSERVLYRLLGTLVDGHEDLTQGVSPVLPALCHQIGELAQQVWREQAEEGELGQGDVLTTLNSTAARHANVTQSLVDEADPQLQHKVTALTEQARADEQLQSTVRYSASASAQVPQAPALWAWLEQREQDMSPRLRRALYSDIGPMGDLIGLFGTMWRTLLDAAPADAAPSLSPLPAAGTELPGIWQPWAEQVASIADAASSDIDLRLRLDGSLGDDGDDLVSSFTEGHLAAAQDVLPAGLLELYFAEDPAPTTAADTLHAYLVREVTARLDAASAPASAPGAPVPAAALAAWHLQDPQGMGEDEDPYPDQAAARAGALQLLAALGDFTRTWSGAQYVSEKALKEITDDVAAALWQDATAEQIGTRPDAAQGCRTLVDLAHTFQFRLEDDSIHEPSLINLTSAAYEHAARMHATTETLAATAEETWPTGSEDGEQQRARILAQTIDKHMPTSQLMRAAGSATWDDTVTYTAPELYALALRTGGEIPVWDNGVLTLTGSDSEPRIFTPVGETADDTMRLALRRPIGAPLEEHGQAFETTLTEPITLEAELDEAGAALYALHKDAVRHLRTVLTDNETITAFDQALPFIGGASRWHEQAAQALELATRTAQTLRAVEEVIGRHSGRHTAQPAHHALRLVQQAAERLAEHLVPDRINATGETYPAEELQQDQEGITALAYLLDHLPFDDDMPAEAGHYLAAALRLCHGHRDVGGLAGEMHRHHKVADAAKTVLNNSGPQRGFYALALHNLARHHVDRLASHLLTLPADGASRRAPAPERPAAESVPVPQGAQSYADAAHGLAAQDDLLELVRAAVLEGQRPLTHGHAPIVLAHLMQAREHG